MFKIKIKKKDEIETVKKIIEPEKLKKIDNIMRTYRENNTQHMADDIIRMFDISESKGWFDTTAYKYRLINKYAPLSVILVTMEMVNGKTVQFVANASKGWFKFNRGCYIIDDDLKYFNQSAKLWAFDYHEQLCFPIKRKIKVNEIKDEIIKDSDVELETAINPISLQSFMESEVIQKLLAGQELDNTLRFIKMGIIIIGIVTTVSLILSLKGTGIV